MKMLRLIAMMLSVCTMYVDGGEGGGGDAGAGEGDAGGQGEGETLLAGKYKTSAELETGYNELFASYSGKDEAHTSEMNALKSPEAYEAGEDWGSDNAMNNRMMAVFQEVGKEHNMSQGMYEALFNGVNEMQTRVQTEQLSEVKESIPNFDNRNNAVVDTALRFLRPDQAESLDAFNNSKESFEALETLMAQLRGGTLPPRTDHSELTDADLRSQIRNLNPADSTKRKELMTILNARGDGEGTMV